MLVKRQSSREKEQSRIEEFESRLTRADTLDEKLYPLMDAIINAEYARQTKRYHRVTYSVIKIFNIN